MPNDKYQLKQMRSNHETSLLPYEPPGYATGGRLNHCVPWRCNGYRIRLKRLQGLLRDVRAGREEMGRAKCSDELVRTESREIDCDGICV